MADLFNDGSCRQLSLIDQRLGIEVGEIDTVPIKRINSVGEERALAHAPAELGTKSQDGGPLAAAHLRLGLFPGGEALDANAARLSKVP